MITTVSGVSSEACADEVRCEVARRGRTAMLNVCHRQRAPVVCGQWLAVDVEGGRYHVGRRKGCALWGEAAHARWQQAQQGGGSPIVDSGDCRCYYYCYYATPAEKTGSSNPVARGPARID
jgi:hypothetical protein